MKNVVVDASYRTSWISKRIIDDGRIPVFLFAFFNKYDKLGYDTMYVGLFCQNFVAND